MSRLYRLTFRYKRSWAVRLGEEAHHLLRGKGRCEGAVSGRFSGRPEEGRVVATLQHVTDDARYLRLNGVLCAVNGVVREREVTLEVAELVWEPIP